MAKEFLDVYGHDLDWVIDEFGDLGSGELELASTIIFADREVARRGSHQNFKELVDRVHAVKPHFAESQIAHLAKKTV